MFAFTIDKTNYYLQIDVLCLLYDMQLFF